MTTSQRLPAGTLLGGRYRLLEPLPGAGRSWHARDEVDRRDLVARVVVLPAAMSPADRDLARQRALQDAAAVSRVHHPGIAPVVDAVVEDGTPWVISVRADGRSLGDVVRADGPLRAETVALVGLQVLDALVAAGVPHGDLTPDDVLLGADGRVTVTGFGTTRVDGTETPGFRAPEGGPSTAADLWALGVALYAAVEGRLPDGPGGGALRPVLDRLLAIDPALRSDTDEVRRLLAQVGGTPPTSPPASPREIHDPEVAAALAALDAAIQAPPVSRPTPPFPPTAPPEAGGPADRRDPATATDSYRPTRPADPIDSTDQAELTNQSDPSDRSDATDAKNPNREDSTGSDPANRAGPGDPRNSSDRANGASRTEPSTPPAAVEPTVRSDRAERNDSVEPASAAGPTEPAGSTGSALPSEPANQVDPIIDPGQLAAASHPAQLGSGAVAAGGSVDGGATRDPGVAVGRARRKRRWSWGALIAVAVLAVAVLVPTLREHGESAPAAVKPRPTPTRSATPTVSAPAPPPAGYRLYRDPAGWSIAVPAAWQPRREGGAVAFRDGDRVLSVTERGHPPADPYADRVARQKASGAAIPGYDFLEVARVPYRHWPTADWEYLAGTQPVMHTVVRTTIPAHGEAFDISWTTEDRRWSADHAVFDTATRTFDAGN